MLQGEGVVLKGGMVIRLAQMACVAGLGKQAQIGQFKRLDLLPHTLQIFGRQAAADTGVHH